MDNPQGTFTSYIAGLFEGEGSVAISSFSVTSNQGRKMPQVRSAVYFTNTDSKLIQTIIDFFKLNGWNYYVRSEKRPKGRMVCYNIQLTKQSDRLSCLQILLPHLRGEKRRLTEITIEFLKYRIELAKRWQIERGGDGRYRTGCKTSYTEKDKEFYQQYKKVRDTSETTRMTPVLFR